ncbi:MAG: hypothetical protein V4591_06465 [Bdellovibrionota bacterium]
MDNSSFGNISWEIFVYGCYIVVAFFLLTYAIYSFYTRRTALKNLQEEGFVEVKNETKN